MWLEQSWKTTLRKSLDSLAFLLKKKKTNTHTPATYSFLLWSICYTHNTGCVMKQGPTVCLRRPHIWRFEVGVLSFRLCFGIWKRETLRSVSPRAEGVPWDTTTLRHYVDPAKCYINLYIQIRPLWIVVMCEYSKWTICYQHSSLNTAFHSN